MTKENFYLLLDINECDNGSHNCHSNAKCTDEDGSFTCECLPGFEGNGVDCQGIVYLPGLFIRFIYYKLLHESIIIVSLTIVVCAGFV